MEIKLSIIDSAGKEIPAEVWIGLPFQKACACTWVVIRAKGVQPFKISKNNLIEKCRTLDYYDCAHIASYANGRLGSSIEWQIVHEAKMRHGLDILLAAIDGDVIGCKPTYTDDDTVVRSYTGKGYMESFSRSQMIGRCEIYARKFANHMAEQVAI